MPLPPVETSPETALDEQWRQLRRLIQRETGCEAIAAEVVQETYLRWFSKPDRDRVGNPGGYLFRAAVNIARTLRQRHGLEQAILRLTPPQASHDERSPERIYADRQKLEEVMRAIDELPPRCREVFVLYRFHGLDQGHIAAQLGISRNMVERHVIRAMRSCREKLHDDS